MARVTENFRHSFNFFIWPLLLTAFFCLLPELTPYFMGSVNNDFARTAVAEGAVYFDAYYQMTLGAILLLLTALPFINPVPNETKFAIVGLLFVSMVHFLVLPIAGNILEQPIKSAAILAKREKLKVISWQDHQPSFNLYAEMITEQRMPRSGDIVFTKTVNLEDKARYKTLYEKHGIILAEILEIGKINSATLHVRDNE